MKRETSTKPTNRVRGMAVPRSAGRSEQVARSQKPATERSDGKAMKRTKGKATKRNG